MAGMSSAGAVEFRIDDLSGSATQDLVAAHLAQMHDQSPPESVHALDLDGLRAPGVTFWSAWIGDEIVGCGALKRLDEQRAEIKSMRVADGWTRRGLGRAILDHLMVEARRAGFSTLWLETGSTDDFVAARAMYERAGFTYCPPFEDYVEDPESVFMTTGL